MPLTTFTVADFERLAQHDYRYALPNWHPHGSTPEQHRIAEGHVQSHAIRPGIRLVLSDIQIHEAYESTSLAPPPFSVIVVLDGEAHTQLARQAPIRVAAHSGMSAIYGSAAPLTGRHPAGQRLRSMNLSLTDLQALPDDSLVERLSQALREQPQRLQPWAMPPGLRLTLEQLAACTWDSALQALLREGVSWQLLAHALAALDMPTRSPRPTLSPRDRQRLERVCDALRAAPDAPHSLTDLASLAHLSPSALRAKFHLAFGCSPFAWLRDYRLTQAQAHLRAGGSVQQAAALAGFRHSTNFATAFRQRYGVAPSAVREGGV